MGRTLVVTSTFPQWEGDPRGVFIRRYWEARASPESPVEILAPQTRWCRDALDGPLTVHRFHYAPRPCSTLSGEFGILENIRARPHRAGLLPPFLIAMYAALRARLARGGYSRVVAHMLVPCGVAAGLAIAGQPELRLEVFGHGTDVDVWLRAPRPVRALGLASLRRAAVIYLPSEDKRRRVFAAFPELARRCQVATMVETVDQLALVRRPVPGRVLFLGRLIEQKGVDELVHALAGLGPGVELHVAGDGPERGRLTRLAARERVDAVFHGFVAGAQKREVLATAALVCVPSREVRGLSEGAPLVIREAAALDIPVVATRVGGIPELARACPGVCLVAPDDRVALRDALRRQLARGDHAPPAPRVL